MTNPFSKEVQLRRYDCDVTNRLTLTNLIHYLIEVSNGQVNELNEKAGSDPITEAGYAWVIIQYAFEIKRMPQYGERIRIETSYENFTKIFTYRLFDVYDENDNHLIAAKSMWLMIDIADRKMVRITSDLVQNFVGIQEERRLKRTAQPRFEETEQTMTESFKVRYSDIDINEHVNNSNYFEWMQEPLGADFLLNHEPASINIKYEKEVFYGTTIDSIVYIDESEDEIVTMHEIRTGEKTVNAVAEFSWKKTK